MKGETGRLYLQMFKKGKSIVEIAAARNLAVGTIEVHLAGFIPTGEIDVLNLVEAKKLDELITILKANPGLGDQEIKKMMKDKVSYGQLKAISFHLANLNSISIK